MSPVGERREWLEVRLDQAHRRTAAEAIEGFADHESAHGMTQRMNRDPAIVGLRGDERPDAGVDKSNGGPLGGVEIGQIGVGLAFRRPVETDDCAGQFTGETGCDLAMLDRDIIDGCKCRFDFPQKRRSKIPQSGGSAISRSRDLGLRSSAVDHDA